MNNLPQIIVKQGLERETRLFHNFLNHPKFPENRSYILKAFPELENLIDKSKDELLYDLKQFIDNFYRENEKIISEINNKATKLLEKESSVVLEALGNLMEYDWEEKIVYLAIPSILPFSLFGKKSFSFSILSKIRGKEKHGPKNILRIAIHEISHIIFLSQLEKIEEKVDIKLSVDIEHYLKEALVASLLNQEPLKELLKLKNYQGNPEIRELHLEDDGEIIKIADYITRQYEKAKSDNKSFEIFLTELIGTFNKKSGKFTEKRSLWKMHGIKILKNIDILTDYKKPIKIN